MRWKDKFKRRTRSEASNEVLANVLNRLRLGKEKENSHELSPQLPRKSQEGSNLLRKRVTAVVKKVVTASDASASAKNATETCPVDVDMLHTLCEIIQDTMHEQHLAQEERWPRKLQWPSLRYLRASWVYIWEGLQPDVPFFQPGEAKVVSANAGHVACLGPAILQAPIPVHTLIVHGDLEYCTLLGHRLHVDLGVYFAALRTLAHFLRGNTELRELVFAFTGCPKVVTDKSQQPVAQCFAEEVLPAFERTLEENSMLRYVSFRMSHAPTQHISVRRLCETSFEANSRQRCAVLCALHPRVAAEGNLVASLPHDIIKRILDTAFPLPIPSSRVDFEFSHITSSRNRTRFSFLKLGCLAGTLGRGNSFPHAG